MTGAAGIGGARRDGADLLPRELHGRELRSATARIRMGLTQPPPVGAAQLVLRRPGSYAQHLVRRGRNRAVGHSLAVLSCGRGEMRPMRRILGRPECAPEATA